MTRFLVLSGGAASCAYEVGAVRYLIDIQNRTYDAYYGISGGALNAAFLSSYSLEKEAIKNLSNIWYNLKKSDIYQNWTFGYLSLLWRNSLYDTSPLRKTLENNISPDNIKNSGKKLSIQTVALATGSTKVFTEQDPDIISAILASSAMPIYFPPQKIQDVLYIDGGAKDMSNIEDAISENDVDEIDLILTYPKDITADPDTDFSFLELIQRFIRISIAKIGIDDILIAGLENKLGKNIKINIIRPQQELPISTLGFCRDDIEKIIDIGFNDAKTFWSTL